VKDFLRAELPELGGARLVQPASLVRRPPAAPRALVIRAGAPGDSAALVRIVREIVDEGTSFAFAPDTTDEELRAYWLASFVVCEEGQVVGCYFAGRGRRPRLPRAAVQLRREHERGGDRAMDQARFLERRSLAAFVRSPEARPRRHARHASGDRRQVIAPRAQARR
jgi:hypothetical protein